MIDYIKGRVKEITSLHGGALIAMGVIVLLGGPILTMAAYAAIVWGAIAIIKKD
mgnify:FL=1|tara:strand:+ start:1503 stop:1664 length:162 start_codon:yes stop_codon:yes gene_type:complete